jgi:hypothetical protein
MVGKRVTFDDETWIRDLSRAKGVVSRRSDRLGRLLPLTVARQKPRATAPHGTVACQKCTPRPRTLELLRLRLLRFHCPR